MPDPLRRASGSRACAANIEVENDFAFSRGLEPATVRHICAKRRVETCRIFLRWMMDWGGGSQFGLPDEFAMQSKPPVVICPGCRKPMDRVAEGRRSSLKEITYVCRSCGANTKRYVAGDAAPACTRLSE
jgi:Zn finger protein HypA/HybF involved in hydrogenase expression